MCEMDLMRHICTRNVVLKTGPLALGLSLAIFGVMAGVAHADIVNNATASGTYAAATYNSNVSSAAVPVATSAPQMVVTKTANPTSGLKAGDTVTYTYTVKNSGTVTITNVSLNDVHNASGLAPVPKNETLSSDVTPSGDSTDATPNDGVWSTLAPGDTITLTATYTVTQSDLDNLQ